MNNNTKTILVTGASNGIGLALTAKLLTDGFQVIAVTRSGEVPGLSDENLWPKYYLEAPQALLPFVFVNYTAW